MYETTLLGTVTTYPNLRKSLQTGILSPRPLQLPSQGLPVVLGALEDTLG